jgi:antitoxin MazE
LSVQDLDFHLNLLNQHREHTFALVQVGQFSTGGVGQFYSGANINDCCVYVSSPSCSDSGRKDAATTAVDVKARRIYNVDTMLGTIARWGNSLALRLPKNALDVLGLHEGDPVTLEARDGRLIIEPAQRIDLDAMIAAITPETLPEENFDSAPVGRELL